MVGEKLIAAGIITEDQLALALAEGEKTGTRVGDAVVALGFATAEQVESVFA
jgi:hypothetical protein